MADRAYLERLTKELVDKGQLMEAGWLSLRLAAIPAEASALQLTAMRKAFFAGAQHYHASIMTFLDSEREPTEDDLRRMTSIAEELEKFAQLLELEIASTKGSA